jgi:hypothetical protein
LQNQFDIRVLKAVLEEEKEQKKKIENREQLVRIPTEQRGCEDKKKRERKEKKRKREKEKKNLLQIH